MNSNKLLFSFIGIFMMLSIGFTTQAQDEISIDNVVGLMAQAHTQYNQIYAIYVMDLAEQQTRHEVWLDNASRQFRHEVISADNQTQLTVSDGSYVYIEPGPTGIPITLKALPSPQSEPLANRMLGGIGTLISPVFAVENLLSRSEVTILTTETFSTEHLLQPVTAAQLRIQAPELPLIEFWVDIETGIIVRQVIYAPDGNVFSTATLEVIEFDGNISRDLFFVDANQYNVDQLHEIFPPSPINE